MQEAKMSDADNRLLADDSRVVCAMCGATGAKADMLGTMALDETSPLGMRAVWFCDRCCMATWMDAMDAEA
jgi:hypothetical protein